MTPTGLLENWEAHSHKERMEGMMKLGREATTNSATRSLVTELCQGSLYEQLLGLQTCHGTWDTAPVRQALRSPSKILKTRAAPIMAVIGSDDEVLEELREAPSYLLKPLATALRRRKRLDVIDTYLEELANSDEDDSEEMFNKLLPLASTNTVRRHLPRVLDTFGRTNLSHLPLLHAEVVFTLLRDRLALCVDLDASFCDTINVLLQSTKASGHVPALWDLILDVARHVPRSTTLSKLHFQALVTRRPQEFCQLVIDRKETFSLSFSKVFTKLSTSQLVALQKLNRYTIGQYSFESLTEEQRLAIYRIMNMKWRSTNGTLSPTTVSALPTEQRIAEARRHIQLPTFQVYPAGRIPYAALLPWQEAMELQKPFLRSNQVEERSAALTAQIRAAGDQPEHTGDALALVLPRKYEQDPVRSQLLAALADLPPHNWIEDHLVALTQIIRDSLDAVDLSGDSIQSILRLLTQILSFYTSWASEQLALVIAERQQIPSQIPFTRKSSRNEKMAIFFKSVLPVLTRLREQDREDLIVSMASALGDGLPSFLALMAMLEGILQDTRSISLASKIFELYSEYEPDRLKVLIPQLLDADPGWIALEFVDDFVLHHKLVKYENFKESIGRFGAFRPFRPRRSGNESEQKPWKSTQLEQEAEKDLLMAAIKDRERDAYTWKTSIVRLGILCFVDAKYMIALASDDRLVVRQTAIFALGRLDAGQGLSTLIEALGDDRARFAIYALRRELKYVPKDELLNILKAAPMKKVTVAKEVVRLMAELDTEPAYEEILRIGQGEIHRDVFIAVLRLLSPHCHRDEIFALYGKAARHEDAAIAKTVIIFVPSSGSSDENGARWMTLLAVLLSHPQAEVRLDALHRCLSNLSDPNKMLVYPLFQLLQSELEMERSSAAASIMKLYSCTHESLVGDLFKMFLGNRAVLIEFVEAFCSHIGAEQEQKYPATKLVLDLLDSHPLTVSLRTMIVFRAVPGRVLLSHVIQLAPEFHADALVKAKALTDNLGSRDDVDLPALEHSLAFNADNQLRRLGLSALLRLSRGSEGWTWELRERLLAYQRDTSTLVAEAACSVFPPKLDEE